MRSRTLTRMAAAAALTVAAQSALPQQPATDLPSAVRKALDSGPEVTARLNALKASGEAISVARGALLPRVDLEAEAGRTNDRITSRSPQSGSLNRTGVSLSVTQLLWDGMVVQRDVDRLGHERLARWFDLTDASEQTALEVTRAWIDVQRMRRLVQLSEDNYVQHRYAFDQIQSRVKAGVGRGVDLEQANARLALAESNLTTERSNLHDVSERYLRLVGEAPPAPLAKATGLEKLLPTSAAEATVRATRQSPTISAAIENLRAARSTAQARDAALWQPRVEARARLGGGNNFDGVPDQKRDTNVALVLNWNLYSGGADQARVRQQTNVVNQAADLRDKACRDARQTAAIAYNDVTKLSEQLPLLERNTLAIERARDAYRQQFDIGQRSLLDLLNAENEVYTARRAYTNAENDLALAQARTQASSGRLLATLGLRPADSTELAPDADKWDAGEDVAARCPLEVNNVAAASQGELDARVQKLAAAGRPAPVATPAPVAAAVVAPAPKPAPAVSMAETEASQRLRDWAAAWSAKDLNRYFGFYAPEFKPAKGKRAAWEANRRRLVGKPGPLSVQVDEIVAKVQPSGAVLTDFDQQYSSSGYKDRSRKQLLWQRVDGQWVIIRESNR